MALLRTSYMYGGFLEYYFRLQFSAFWSMHDKTSSWENANFKMYPSPQNWITSIKKFSISQKPHRKSFQLLWSNPADQAIPPWENPNSWKFNPL